MAKGQESNLRSHLEQAGTGQNTWDTIFRYVKAAAQDSAPWEKGHKQGQPYNCLSLLPRVSLQAIEQKEGTQTEPSNLTELKRHRSEFREFRTARICGQWGREEGTTEKETWTSAEGAPYIFVWPVYA